MCVHGRKAEHTDRQPLGRPRRASGKSAGRGTPPPMTAAVPMALSESRNRWAPGLASQRLLCMPNRAPRRSRASSSSAWCTRRLGVRSFGRSHCPSTSSGRLPTAKCCPPGVVFGGVHRPSQARASGEWWQPTAGPATARSARRNGRACGPTMGVGGAKQARAVVARRGSDDEPPGFIMRGDLRVFAFRSYMSLGARARVCVSWPKAPKVLKGDLRRPKLKIAKSAAASRPPRPKTAYGVARSACG